ncbi:MAG: hypothetical protein H7Z73_09435 [Candidatus Saccharibacteria bacterium]|nr:hypothetical protein [Moraxellaceae bacterium]
MGNLVQLFEYFSIYGIGLHVIIAIFLPNTRMHYGFRQFTAQTSGVLNPNRELLAARQAYNLTASVHNHLRVANALRAMGNMIEAVKEFESCLTRASDSDLQVRLVTAYANFDVNQHQRVLVLLSDSRAKDANYHVEDVTLLAALTLAEMGENDAAREQFEYLMRCFGSVEICVEYAICLLKQKELEQAQIIKAKLEQTASHWDRRAQHMNRYAIQKVKNAFKNIAKS